MLPSSKQDYQYYSYLIIRITLVIIIIGGMYEYGYLKYILETSILDKSYQKYLLNTLINNNFERVTYWISYISLFLLGSLIGYFVYKNPHSLTKRFSNFATKNDIRKMSPSPLKDDGFALGSYQNKILKTNEPLGLLCVAPAGAGKTTGIVIPTILSCDKDSLIVNDPKGELYDLTYKYREKISTVYRIEWGQSKEEQNEKTIYWNPIALENLPEGTAERAKYVEMIVNILIKETKGDAFWSQSGRKTLGAMMLYSIYKNELENKSATIGEIKDILATIGMRDEEDEAPQQGQNQKDPTQEGFKLKAIEVENLEIPEVIKKRCYTVFAELSTTASNTLGSILATVSSNLMVFNNENVREITSKNSFSMKDIRGKEDIEIVQKKWLFFKKKIKVKKPVSVYLISPAAEQELFGVLSGIFCEVAYKYITSELLKKVKKSNIVRFILDEVAFFPKISAVIDGPAIARGYKGSFLFVCQDLAQIVDKYGANALNTMFTNTAFKIILPQNNDETAKRLASLGGQKQIKEWQGIGKNRQKVKKIINLIEANDVMSMPAGKQIVFVQNNAKTPIYCDIPFFFKNKEMKRKIDKSNK